MVGYLLMESVKGVLERWDRIADNDSDR